jgi:hypothetical protein
LGIDHHLKILGGRGLVWVLLEGERAATFTLELVEVFLAPPDEQGVGSDVPGRNRRKLVLLEAWSDDVLFGFFGDRH